MDGVGTGMEVSAAGRAGMPAPVDAGRVFPWRTYRKAMPAQRTRQRAIMRFMIYSGSVSALGGGSFWVAVSAGLIAHGNYIVIGPIILPVVLWRNLLYIRT